MWGCVVCMSRRPLLDEPCSTLHSESVPVRDKVGYILFGCSSTSVYCTEMQTKELKRGILGTRLVLE